MSGRRSKKNQRLGSSRRGPKGLNRNTEKDDDDGFQQIAESEDGRNEFHTSTDYHSTQFDHPPSSSIDQQTSPLESLPHAGGHKDSLVETELPERKRKMGSTRKSAGRFKVERNLDEVRTTEDLEEEYVTRPNTSTTEEQHEEDQSKPMSFPSDLSNSGLGKEPGTTLMFVVSENEEKDAVRQEITSYSHVVVSDMPLQEAMGTSVHSFAVTAESDLLREDSVMFDEPKTLCLQEIPTASTSGQKKRMGSTRRPLRGKNSVQEHSKNMTENERKAEVMGEAKLKMSEEMVQAWDDVARDDPSSHTESALVSNQNLLVERAELKEIDISAGTETMNQTFPLVDSEKPLPETSCHYGTPLLNEELDFKFGSHTEDFDVLNKDAGSENSYVLDTRKDTNTSYDFRDVNTETKEEVLKQKEELSINDQTSSLLPKQDTQLEELALNDQESSLSQHDIDNNCNSSMPQLIVGGSGSFDVPLSNISHDEPTTTDLPHEMSDAVVEKEQGNNLCNVAAVACDTLTNLKSITEEDKDPQILATRENENMSDERGSETENAFEMIGQDDARDHSVTQIIMDVRDNEKEGETITETIWISHQTASEVSAEKEEKYREQVQYSSNISQTHSPPQDDAGKMPENDELTNDKKETENTAVDDVTSKSEEMFCFEDSATDTGSHTHQLFTQSPYKESYDLHERVSEKSEKKEIFFSVEPENAFFDRGDMRSEGTEGIKEMDAAPVVILDVDTNDSKSENPEQNRALTEEQTDTNLQVLQVLDNVSTVIDSGLLFHDVIDVSSGERERVPDNSQDFYKPTTCHPESQENTGDPERVAVGGDTDLHLEIEAQNKTFDLTSEAEGTEKNMQDAGVLAREVEVTAEKVTVESNMTTELNFLQSSPDAHVEALKLSDNTEKEVSGETDTILEQSDISIIPADSHREETHSESSPVIHKRKMGSTRRPLKGNKGRRKEMEHHDENETLDSESMINIEKETFSLEKEPSPDESTLQSSKDGAKEQMEISEENDVSPVEGSESALLQSSCSSDLVSEESTAISICHVTESQDLTKMNEESQENAGDVERVQPDLQLKIDLQNETFDITTREVEGTEENTQDISVMLVREVEVIGDTVTVESNMKTESDFLQTSPVEALKVSENAEKEASGETDTILKQNDISIIPADSHGKETHSESSPVVHKRKMGSTRRPLKGKKGQRQEHDEKEISNLGDEPSPDESTLRSSKDEVKEQEVEISEKNDVGPVEGFESALLQSSCISDLVTEESTAISICHVTESQTLIKINEESQENAGAAERVAAEEDKDLQLKIESQNKTFDLTTGEAEETEENIQDVSVTLVREVEVIGDTVTVESNMKTESYFLQTSPDAHVEALKVSENAEKEVSGETDTIPEQSDINIIPEDAHGEEAHSKSSPVIHKRKMGSTRRPLKGNKGRRKEMEHHDENETLDSEGMINVEKEKIDLEDKPSPDDSTLRSSKEQEVKISEENDVVPVKGSKSTHLQSSCSSDLVTEESTAISICHVTESQDLTKMNEESQENAGDVERVQADLQLKIGLQNETFDITTREAEGTEENAQDISVMLVREVEVIGDTVTVESNMKTESDFLQTSPDAHVEALKVSENAEKEVSGETDTIPEQSDISIIPADSYGEETHSKSSPVIHKRKMGSTRRPLKGNKGRRKEIEHHDENETLDSEGMINVEKEKIDLEDEPSPDESTLQSSKEQEVKISEENDVVPVKGSKSAHLQSSCISDLVSEESTAISICHVTEPQTLIKINEESQENAGAAENVPAEEDKHLQIKIDPQKQTFDLTTSEAEETEENIQDISVTLVREGEAIGDTVTVESNLTTESDFCQTSPDANMEVSENTDSEVSSDTQRNSHREIQPENKMIDLTYEAERIEETICEASVSVKEDEFIVDTVIAESNVTTESNFLESDTLNDEKLEALNLSNNTESVSAVTDSLLLVQDNVTEGSRETDTFPEQSDIKIIPEDSYEEEAHSKSSPFVHKRKMGSTRRPLRGNKGQRKETEHQDENETPDNDGMINVEKETINLEDEPSPDESTLQSLKDGAKEQMKISEENDVGFVVESKSALIQSSCSSDLVSDEFTTVSICHVTESQTITKMYVESQENTGDAERVAAELQLKIDSQNKTFDITSEAEGTEENIQDVSVTLVREVEVIGDTVTVESNMTTESDFLETSPDANIEALKLSDNTEKDVSGETDTIPEQSNISIIPADSYGEEAHSKSSPVIHKRKMGSTRRPLKGNKGRRKDHDEKETLEDEPCPDLSGYTAVSDISESQTLTKIYAGSPENTGDVERVQAEEDKDLQLKIDSQNKTFDVTTSEAEGTEENIHDVSVTLVREAEVFGDTVTVETNIESDAHIEALKVSENAEKEISRETDKIPEQSDISIIPKDSHGEEAHSVDTVTLESNMTTETDFLQTSPDAHIEALQISENTEKDVPGETDTIPEQCDISIIPADSHRQETHSKSSPVIHKRKMGSTRRPLRGKNEQRKEIEHHDENETFECESVINIEKETFSLENEPSTYESTIQSSKDGAKEQKIGIQEENDVGPVEGSESTDLQILCSSDLVTEESTTISICHVTESQTLTKINEESQENAGDVERMEAEEDKDLQLETDENIQDVRVTLVKEVEVIGDKVTMVSIMTTESDFLQSSPDAHVEALDLSENAGKEVSGETDTILKQSDINIIPEDAHGEEAHSKSSPVIHKRKMGSTRRPLKGNKGRRKEMEHHDENETLDREDMINIEKETFSLEDKPSPDESTLQSSKDGAKEQMEISEENDVSPVEGSESALLQSSCSSDLVSEESTAISICHVTESQDLTKMNEESQENAGDVERVQADLQLKIDLQNETFDITTREVEGTEENTQDISVMLVREVEVIGDTVTVESNMKTESDFLQTSPDAHVEAVKVSENAEKEVSGETDTILEQNDISIIPADSHGKETHSKSSPVVHKRKMGSTRRPLKGKKGQRQEHDEKEICNLGDEPSPDESTLRSSKDEVKEQEVEISEKNDVGPVEGFESALLKSSCISDLVTEESTAISICHVTESQTLIRINEESQESTGDVERVAAEEDKDLQIKIDSQNKTFDITTSEAEETEENIQDVSVTLVREVEVTGDTVTVESNMTTESDFLQTSDEHVEAFKVSENAKKEVSGETDTIPVQSDISIIPADSHREETHSKSSPVIHKRKMGSTRRPLKGNKGRRKDNDEKEILEDESSPDQSGYIAVSIDDISESQTLRKSHAGSQENIGDVERVAAEEDKDLQIKIDSQNKTFDITTSEAEVTEENIQDVSVTLVREVEVTGDTVTVESNMTTESDFLQTSDEHVEAFKVSENAKKEVSGETDTIPEQSDISIIPADSHKEKTHSKSSPVIHKRKMGSTRRPLKGKTERREDYDEKEIFNLKDEPSMGEEQMEIHENDVGPVEGSEIFILEDEPNPDQSGYTAVSDISESQTLTKINTVSQENTGEIAPAEGDTEPHLENKTFDSTAFEREATAENIGEGSVVVREVDTSSEAEPEALKASDNAEHAVLEKTDATPKQSDTTIIPEDTHGEEAHSKLHPVVHKRKMGSTRRPLRGNKGQREEIEHHDENETLDSEGGINAEKDTFSLKDEPSPDESTLQSTKDGEKEQMEISKRNDVGPVEESESTDLQSSCISDLVSEESTTISICHVTESQTLPKIKKKSQENTGDVERMAAEEDKDLHLKIDLQNQVFDLTTSEAEGTEDFSVALVREIEVIGDTVTVKSNMTTESDFLQISPDAHIEALKASENAEKDVSGETDTILEQSDISIIPADSHREETHSKSSPVIHKRKMGSTRRPLKGNKGRRKDHDEKEILEDESSPDQSGYIAVSIDDISESQTLRKSHAGSQENTGDVEIVPAEEDKDLQLKIDSQNKMFDVTTSEAEVTEENIHDVREVEVIGDTVTVESNMTTESDFLQSSPDANMEALKLSENAKKEASGEPDTIPEQSNISIIPADSYGEEAHSKSSPVIHKRKMGSTRRLLKGNKGQRKNCDEKEILEDEPNLDESRYTAVSDISESQTLTKIHAGSQENIGDFETAPVEGDTEPCIENKTFDSTAFQGEATEENICEDSVLDKEIEFTGDTVTMESNMTIKLDLLQNDTSTDAKPEALISEIAEISGKTDTIPKQSDTNIIPEDPHGEKLHTEVSFNAHKRKMGSTRRPLRGNTGQRKVGVHFKEKNGDGEGVSEEEVTETHSEIQNQDNAVGHNVTQEIMYIRDNEDEERKTMKTVDMSVLELSDDLELKQRSDGPSQDDTVSHETQIHVSSDDLPPTKVVEMHPDSKRSTQKRKMGSTRKRGKRMVNEEEVEVEKEGEAVNTIDNLTTKSEENLPIEEAITGSSVHQQLFSLSVNKESRDIQDTVSKSEISEQSDPSSTINPELLIESECSSKAAAEMVSDLPLGDVETYLVPKQSVIPKELHREDQSDFNPVVQKRKMGSTRKTLRGNKGQGRQGEPQKMDRGIKEMTQEQDTEPYLATSARKTESKFDEEVEQNFLVVASNMFPESENKVKKVSQNIHDLTEVSENRMEHTGNDSNSANEAVNLFEGTKDKLVLTVSQEDVYQTLSADYPDQHVGSEHEQMENIHHFIPTQELKNTQDDVVHENNSRKTPATQGKRRKMGSTRRNPRVMHGKNMADNEDVLGVEEDSQSKEVSSVSISELKSEMFDLKVENLEPSGQTVPETPENTPQICDNQLVDADVTKHPQSETVSTEKRRKMGSTRKNLREGRIRGKRDGYEDTETADSEMSLAREVREQTIQDYSNQSEDSLLSEIEKALNKKSQSSPSCDWELIIKEPNPDDLANAPDLNMPENSEIKSLQPTPSAEPNSPGRRRRKMGSTRKNPRQQFKAETEDEDKEDREIDENLKTDVQEKKDLERVEVSVVHNITENKEYLDVSSAHTSSSQLEESTNPVSQEKTSPSTKRKFGSRRANKGKQGLGRLSDFGNESEDGDHKPDSAEVQDKLHSIDLTVYDPSCTLPPASQPISHPVSEQRNMEAKNEEAASKGTGAGLVSLDQTIKHNRITGAKQTVNLKNRISDADVVQFNIVMVGNSCVGKTSFIRRFHEGQFTEDYRSTIGVDTCVQTVALPDKIVKLQIWDTAGQERFHSITTQVFHRADGLLFMYEITSSNSFVSVRDWISRARERAPDDAIMMLLGNKNDSVERQVQIQEGEDLAREYNMHFMECSAATGANVSESMRTLAELLAQQRKSQKEKHATLRRETPQKKSGCC